MAASSSPCRNQSVRGWPRVPVALWILLDPARVLSALAYMGVAWAKSERVWEEVLSLVSPR